VSVVDRILRHRNRFPNLVNRAVDYVADHPTGFLGRLAARRLGTVDEVPGTSTADDKPVRVLIAPVNYSNQGRMWAQSLEAADPSISARNMAVDVPGGFSFPADLIVPLPAYHNSPEWQRAQLEAVRGFTHVLVEAEEPLFGRLFGRDLASEVRDLLASGVDVAFMAHGTDIRLPSRHAGRTSWSPYRDPKLYLARLERVAAANLELLSRSGRPVFVSTPDLLFDFPSAVWCPVVVDPLRWATPGRDAAAGPLRVVHAPSSALIKGTHLIEPTLRRLHERGVIEYRRIVDVPSSSMPAVFGGVDVVLDQFRLGSYGVAACEAMAAGRLVIGHVLEEVRAEVLEATGIPLPIVEATPDTLEAVLVEAAGNRRALDSARRAGIEFVSAVHDGRMSARVLRENWIAPTAATPGPEGSSAP
jgi:hypothetical protein